MRNLDQLKRQHLEIYAVINETKAMIKKADFENDGQVIARNISTLAGKLQIHLGNEDRFLYPSFLNSESAELKTKAQAYVTEMGNLSEVYTTFKLQFNTRPKILADTRSFVKNADLVFKAIEKRMHKEDNDLYKIAEKL